MDADLRNSIQQIDETEISSISSRSVTREAQLIDKLQLIAGTGMKELAEQLSQPSRRSTGCSACSPACRIYTVSTAYYTI